MNWTNLASELSVPAGMSAAVIEGFIFGSEVICDGVTWRKPTTHFLDAGAAFCSGLISSTYLFRSWHLFFI